MLQLDTGVDCDRGDRQRLGNLATAMRRSAAQEIRRVEEEERWGSARWDRSTVIGSAPTAP